MGRRALVIQHLAFEGLGNLETILLENHFEIDYLQAGVDSFKSLKASDYDLWVVLGGPIGVYEDEAYPFLLDEISLIRQRIAVDKPLLGICLGAQLIAVAQGARVYAGGTKEIGWSPIQLAYSEGESILEPLISNCGVVLHWHGDTFDLPENAQLLASSAIYPHQAFAIGNAILALQFHPEVTPEQFEAWLIGHTVEIAKAGLSVNGLRADAWQFAADMQPGAQKVWVNWLASNQLLA